MKFGPYCLSETAKRVRQSFPDEVNRCLSLADQICGNTFVFREHWEMERTNKPVTFGNNILWDETPNGDIEWVYAFNRHSIFPVLGQAWRYSGQQKYPETFVRLAGDWLARAPLTEQSAKTTWRPLEAGIRCENWLRAFALFENSPAFTGEFRSRMEKSLGTHAEWLIESHGAFQVLSNWGIMQNHGLYLLGIAFDRTDWRELAASRLDEALGAQVMPDGSHWEQSPMYHGEVLHCCLDTILAAQRGQHTLPGSFLKRACSLAKALAFLIRPDGLLVCQSDSDEIDARDLLVQAALLFEDPLLKAYAGAALFPQTLWDFGADVQKRYEALPMGKRIGSVALPDSGNYMLWDGTDHNAGFLHFHCGTLGSGHGHADQLHVDLICNKETILADSGRFTYVELPIRESFKRPSAHNTTLVDGEDFTVYRSSWNSGPIAEPIKGEYRFTHIVDYVSGAHLGYLGMGVFTRRRVLRLGHGLWVFWDEFHTAGDAAHTYERFFHFGPGAEVNLCGQGIEYMGRRCAARFVFPGEGLSFGLEQKSLSREYNRLEEGGFLTVTAKRGGTCGLVTVAAVETGRTAPPLTVTPLEVSLVKSGQALPPHTAGAVRVNRDGEEWVVLVCMSEIISEVDMLAAGGKAGYGKVLVFGPDGYNYCLAY